MGDGKNDGFDMKLFFESLQQQNKLLMEQNQSLKKNQGDLAEQVRILETKLAQQLPNNNTSSQATKHTNTEQDKLALKEALKQLEQAKDKVPKLTKTPQSNAHTFLKRLDRVLDMKQNVKLSVPRSSA